MPQIVPTKALKTGGFNFLPPGTLRLHNERKWGLYYYAPGNMSYMVYDQGKYWRITPIIGRVRIKFAKGVAATKPCCQED